MRLRNEAIAALRLLMRGVDRRITWRLALAAGLSVAGGALTALAPLALKELVDALAAHGAGTGMRARESQAAWIGALAAGYLVCQCAVRFLAELRPALASGAEQQLYARLRRAYFAHLLALPLQFHLARRTGALLQELQQASTGYQIILFHAVSSLIPILVEAIMVMLVLNSLNQPALTGVIGATALAYLLFMSWRNADLRAAATTVSDASVEVQALLAEGLIGVEPIKVFGAERRSVAQLQDASTSLARAWSALQRHRLHRGVLLIAVFAVSMSTGMLLAVRAVAEGTLTVGGFVLANLYMLQLIRPLEMLSGALRDVSQGLAFVRPLVRIMEIPTTPPLSVAPPATAGVSIPANQDAARHHPATPCAVDPVPRRAPQLAYRGIELALDGRPPLLKEFDLEIAAGRTTAIVGKSGCGKSSLVRLLLRLIDPQRGSILIDGVAIASMPIEQLRASVAVVPQDVALFNASIGVNIAFGKDHATQPEIERAADLAGLRDFIASLPSGYDTPIGERGLQLSGGERQRIAIARAILRDPLIYVFDEATSMLDTTTEAQILRNVRRISAGCTTITIAHRLRAIQHADHIAVMADGRIVEQGSHRALLERAGAYAALWREQRADVRAVLPHRVDSLE